MPIKNKMAKDEKTSRESENEKANITWHAAVIQFGKSRLSLGLCTRTGHIAFLAVWNPKQPITEEYLKILIVKDVYIEENRCEDGKRCIDITCPLSHAEVANFKKYNIHTKEELKKLHNTLEKWKNELHLSLYSQGAIMFYEKPLGTFKRNKQ